MLNYSKIIFFPGYFYRGCADWSGGSLFWMPLRKYYLLILTADLWQETSWYHSSVFPSGSEENISPEIFPSQISELFFTSDIISQIMALWKKKNLILLFNKDEMLMSSAFMPGTHLYDRRVQLQRCYSKEVKCPGTCHAVKTDLVWLRHPTLPFYVGMFLKEYLVLTA